MTIVPALLGLLGDRAWHLPRWLDHVLPNVDVEGEQLTRWLDAPEQEPDAEPEPQPLVAV